MRIPAGFRRVFGLRGQVAQEVAAEIGFHLEMRIQDLIEEEGLSPAAAREEALRRFGDVGHVRETCEAIGVRREKETRRSELLGEVRQDVGYAARQMVRSPFFTAIVILTLALGIGATTAIFSLVDAVVLRPLPYPAPERLVRLWETNPQSDHFSSSEPNYLDWRQENRSLAEMAAFKAVTLSLVGDGEPVRLSGAAVTASLFPLLGAHAAVGRTFTAAEDQPGGETQVAVLGNGLWRRRFGADPRVVGRVLSLEGKRYTVIGVLPASFAFSPETDVWIPLAPNPGNERDDKWLDVMGRLKPGVSLAAARADLEGIARRLAERYPESNREWGVRMIPFQEWLVRPEARQMVLVLFSAVGLLLLLGCANISNLLLARATTRGRELGLRAALGAGRARLIRQLLTESVLLAGMGAAAGLAVAQGALRLLRTLGPQYVPRLEEVSLDGRVLAFTLVLSLATGILFGIAPALQASRTDLHALLRQGGRGDAAGAGGMGGRRLRDALVIAELALAMMLLIGAGLMIGSFLRLQNVDKGFDPDGVVAVKLQVPENEYSEERMRAFFAEVSERIGALPGVVSVGATNADPFGLFEPRINYTVDGQAPQRQSDFLSADWRSVTPGFFRALGIPLRKGRLFSAEDRDGAEKVVVINETMARSLWPGEDPIGKRILWTGLASKPRTVIGVVGDIRDMQLDGETRQVIFRPYAQMTWPWMTLMIKTAGTTGDLSNLSVAVRREIHAVDRDLPVPDLVPLRQSMAGPLAAPRFGMLLLGVFAAVALVLAATGVYGIMMFAVTQRTREIGVRLALGAQPWSVVRMILSRGLLLTLIGVGFGWAGAFGLTRFLASLLYGTAPTDSLIFGAVALLLAAVATTATWLPARRAAAIDPRLAFSAD
jgi:putative ABC transport system permease protein